MFKTLTDAFKIKDVRNKLLLTLLLLLIYRLGCWILVGGHRRSQPTVSASINVALELIEMTSPIWDRAV